MKTDTLICRDSKGKIRQVIISCDKENNVYKIKRSSGLYNGKQIEHPEIIVDKGKVKRTIDEQAELVYNSNLKQYLDKGYKNIKDFGYNSLDEFNPEEVLEETKTDQSGAVKPMLAKLIQNVSESTLNKVKEWFISKKIDGQRASLYFNGVEVLSSSRGGGDYNYATSHIRNHPLLIEFFKRHPDIVLDGELYKFGVSLQNISGCARLKEGELPFKLQYYIYDIVDTTKNFYERYKILQQIKKELNLGFDPNKDFLDEELHIQMLPQELVENNRVILWELHDQYVKEGWEGAVLRDPNKVYNPGARDMIKLKSRLDSEFLTVGYELGMRGVEDIVFIMKTKDGKEFKAKPVGSRSVKEDLFKNIDNIIGKLATCTYFYLSDEGVPLQPVWKCVRDKSDL